MQFISKLVESVNQKIPKINAIYTDTITLKNLPDKLTQQRDAFPFLSRREVAGDNFYRVRTYYNRTGTLELKERVDLADIRKRIRHASGCPTIEVTNFFEAKKTLIETTKPPKNGPSLSYVVRDVDKLYTDEDIKEHFEENELNFTKCWRIYSKARNEATKMIRVITHDPESYSDKIAKGLFIYGRMHKCEPSFTSISTPTIKYCNKCCKSGHSFEECQERKIVCPFCGGDHKSADCKQTSEPKCLNCNGRHPAFSFKCPERAKIPESPKETAPILPIKTPPAKDHPIIMQDMMENGIPYQKHELPRAFENVDCLAVDILQNGENIIPADFIEYFSTFNKAILMGDFNARHRQFGDVTENRNGIVLTNLLLDLPIFRTRNVMPTFLNHCGMSVIDHILCTERCSSMMDDE
ncbi:hypothetical protein JTB14_003665 [Gonioctena quinquepunctata]|nr:hypothetical protein JTB14_003665 [Gonioctena quinquepunctata]